MGEQYLKAIDNTEPSQVIRKFLDTQRIHNLIEYLEELHEHHKATADHTTLLLNCYAKLKDIGKLEKFIKSPGDLKFDLDTAISMCGQGGYYDQAAYLATKHGEHELVVDILIEDSKLYSDALQYIWRLEPEAAYPNMMKYARVLLEHCPKDTTEQFIQYFTSDPRILEEAGDELDAVLKKIDEDGLMAPLQVIQTLSTNAVATMGMVKTYLQQTIERERKEIASNRRLITSYRNETVDKRQEISDLSTKPQTFNNTRCSFCGSQLSLPAVHFLCKHSFHQTCLNMEIGEDGNVEGSCPNCRKDNDTVRAIRKAQDESADRHDMFLDALARSNDKFGTISEFFGRGVMEVPPTIE